MAAAKVMYSSASLTTERGRMGRSPCVWNQGGGSAFPFNNIQEDSNLGDFIWDNFMAFNGAAVAANKNNYFTSTGSWHSWEGTGGSITPISGIPIGVTGSLIPPGVGLPLGCIELATSATQFTAAGLESTGGANGASFFGNFAVPSSAAVTAPQVGQFPKVYFEARVRFNQTANMAMFLGLMAPGGATTSNTSAFSAASAFVKQNAIGFAITPVASTGFVTSGTKIQPFYGNATADTVVGAATFSGTVGGIPSTTDYIGQSLAVAVPGLLTDFTKLGFLVDATRPDGSVIRFYQDGILLGAQTIPNIVAANWPSDTALSPAVVIQCATAANDTLDVDWICAGIVLSADLP